MREIEFKMEREGLLKEGDQVQITEGILPASYYYTINPSLAMSGNYGFSERIKDRNGTVKSIVRNERGFYVTVVFQE